MQLSLYNWNYVKIYQKDESLLVFNYLRESSGYQHKLEFTLEDKLNISYKFDENLKTVYNVKDKNNDIHIFSFIEKSYLPYVQEIDMFYNYSKEFLMDNLSMPDFIDEGFKKPSQKYVLPFNKEILASHDMMGGYIEDNSIEVKTPKKGFYFRMMHFMSTTMFNYFSHHFITIPPLSYIKISHDLGNKILGTIIIEKANLYDSLIAEINLEETPLIDKLIDILKNKGFDGYLLNFESK